jgi:hypothetical protein
LSPEGTAETSQDASPGSCWTLYNEDTQDCVLGDFQPSLAGLVRTKSYPGLTSWAILSRPFGTLFRTRNFSRRH